MPGMHGGFYGFPVRRDEDRVAVSSVKALDLTSVDFLLDYQRFDEFELRMVGVRPGTGGVTLQLQMSFDGGASFDAGASDYISLRQLYDSAVGSVLNGGNSSFMPLTVVSDLASGANTGYHGIVRLFDIANPNVVKRCYFDGEYIRTTSGNTARILGAGGRASVTSPLTAIRLQMGSGLIAAGGFHLYGVTR